MLVLWLIIVTIGACLAEPNVTQTQWVFWMRMLMGDMRPHEDL